MPSYLITIHFYEQENSKQENKAGITQPVSGAQGEGYEYCRQVVSLKFYKFVENIRTY